MAHTSPAATPLVAVLTPVYNGARFLEETLACVRAQTYANVVHVVLDNASTDDTPHILARAAATDPKLRVYRNATTIPMRDNWNAVVRRMPPEAAYFRLLCADDVMAPEAIEKMTQVALRNPEIAIVDCERWLGAFVSGALPAGQDVFDGEDVLRRLFMREHTAFTFSSTLVRADLVEPDAPFYGPLTTACIDTEANIRVLMKGKAGFVWERLGDWREHAGTATVAAGLGKRHSLEWLQLLKEYGRKVLNEKDYAEAFRQHRRYHLRRSILDAARGRPDVLTRGMRDLATIGAPVSPLDYVDALADWALLKLSGRGDLVGRPRTSSAS